MFKSTGAGKAWNTKYAGCEALYSIDGNGYRKGYIFARPFKAHRVVWAWVHGCWPDTDVDHRNGNPGDNRLSNLRLATKSQNLSNRGPQINNTSGFKGVYRRGAKYRAIITHNGVQVHIGTFESKIDAARAYNECAIRMNGEFAVLNVLEGREH
ncbi:HNH endonuclease [Sulfitobacter sp. EhC04]|uniref:HNH endonuclease n=1 Tax=Sulfitobacter sp. EhC04 TaxID=1849168 RepID=UPI0009EF4B5C